MTSVNDNRLLGTASVSSPDETITMATSGYNGGCTAVSAYRAFLGTDSESFLAKLGTDSRHAW